jgi:hypothetical protein
MLNSPGRFLFVFPLIFILGLSYWRYTYILNPNLTGEPFLLEYRYYVGRLGASSLVNIRSIFIYWILFFIGNIAFFLTLVRLPDKVKAIAFFFLLISSASGSLFLIEALWISSESLYSLGATLKNFVLSPMFTAVAYLMIKYFHWFGKPK